MKSQADLYVAEERATFGIAEPEDYNLVELMDDDSGDE